MKPDSDIPATTQSVAEPSSRAAQVDRRGVPWLRCVMLLLCAPLVIPLFVVWLLLGGLSEASTDCAEMLDAVQWRCVLLARACRAPRTQDLLLGLPACILLLGVACPLGIVIVFPTAIEQHYQAAANQAVEAQDYAAADLYCRRLTPTPENLLMLARTCAARGQQERCRSLMTTIASTTGEPGRIANLWLANQLLVGPAFDRQSKMAACSHLAAASQQFPEDVRLHRRLGELYLQMGHSKAAANHLVRAVRENPTLALFVARLSLAHGDRTSGQWLAHQALAYWSAQLADDPVNSRARRFVAGARLLLGDYAEAVTCLRQAKVQDRELSAALAETYVAWADAIALRKGDHQRVAALLASALAIDRFHLAAVDRIARLNSAQGAEYQEIKCLLDDLDLEHAPAEIFVVLAGVWSDRGNIRMARQHLERALRIDPSSVAAANNLACLLGRESRHELPRALALVNTVIDSSGAHKAELLDTRATLLKKLGRPVAALNDYSQALQLRPTDARSSAKFTASLGCCIGLACRF